MLLHKVHVIHAIQMVARQNDDVLDVLVLHILEQPRVLAHSVSRALEPPARSASAYRRYTTAQLCCALCAGRGLRRGKDLDKKNIRRCYCHNSRHTSTKPSPPNRMPLPKLYVRDMCRFRLVELN